MLDESGRGGSPEERHTATIVCVYAGSVRSCSRRTRSSSPSRPSSTSISVLMALTRPAVATPSPTPPTSWTASPTFPKIVAPRLRTWNSALRWKQPASSSRGTQVSGRSPLLFFCALDSQAVDETSHCSFHRKRSTIMLHKGGS